MRLRPCLRTVHERLSLAVSLGPLGGGRRARAASPVAQLIQHVHQPLCVGFDAVVDALQDRPVVAQLEHNFSTHLAKCRAGVLMFTTVDLAIELVLLPQLVDELVEPGIELAKPGLDSLQSAPRPKHLLDCATQRGPRGLTFVTAW